MPITEEQRQARRNSIGASDVPALVGCDPYRTAYDVYLEKTGDLAPDKSSYAAELGNWLEEPLVYWAADELGLQDVVLNVSRVAVDEPHRTATLDGLGFRTIGGQDIGEIIEAKTARILWDPRDEAPGNQWGAAGTDEVPDRVLVQNMAQMSVTGLARANVAAFIGGKGRILYRIERDEELIATLDDLVNRIWFDHVQARKPPDGSWPQLATLKRMRREHKTIDVGEDVAELWEELEAVKCELGDNKAMIEDLKTHILVTFDNAEVARLPDGREITCIHQSLGQKLQGNGLERFKREHPDLWSEYAETGSAPQLKIRKAKG